MTNICWQRYQNKHNNNKKDQEKDSLECTIVRNSIAYVELFKKQKKRIIENNFKNTNLLLEIL